MSGRLAITISVLLCSILSCAQVCAQGASSAGTSKLKKDSKDGLVLLYQQDVEKFCSSKQTEFSFWVRSVSTGCDQLEICLDYVAIKDHTGEEQPFSILKDVDVTGDDWQHFVWQIGLWGDTKEAASVSMLPLEKRLSNLWMWNYRFLTKEQ